jgi:hypothetical protein
VVGRGSQRRKVPGYFASLALSPPAIGFLQLEGQATAQESTGLSATPNTLLRPAAVDLTPRAEWFNPTRFAAPPAYRFGNIGRNASSGKAKSPASMGKVGEEFMRKTRIFCLCLVVMTCQLVAVCLTRTGNYRYDSWRGAGSHGRRYCISTDHGVGSATQSVQVKANAALIETTDTRLGETVSARFLICR